MTIDQQFWSYFANDVSPHEPNSGPHAWSYDGEGFQRQGCLEYLKSNSFVCSIVEACHFKEEELTDSYLSQELPFSSLVLIYHKDAPTSTIDILSLIHI